MLLRTFRNLLLLVFLFLFAHCNTQNCKYPILHDTNKIEISYNNGNHIIGIQRQKSESVTLLILKVDSSDCHKYKSFPAEVNDILIGNSILISNQNNRPFIIYKDIEQEILLDEENLKDFDSQVMGFVSRCNETYNK